MCGANAPVWKSLTATGFGGSAAALPHRRTIDRHQVWPTVRTAADAPGAAQLIGAQAPLALHPGEPQRLRAIAPPDPRLLRRQIEGDDPILARWAASSAAWPACA